MRGFCRIIEFHLRSGLVFRPVESIILNLSCRVATRSSRRIYIGPVEADIFVDGDTAEAGEPEDKAEHKETNIGTSSGMNEKPTSVPESSRNNSVIANEPHLEACGSGLSGKVISGVKVFES